MRSSCAVLILLWFLGAPSQLGVAQETTPNRTLGIKPVVLASSLTSLFAACNKLGEGEGSNRTSADELRKLIQTEISADQQAELRRLASMAKAYTGPLAGVVKVPKAELEKLGLTDDELKSKLRQFALEYDRFTKKYLPPPPPPKP